MRSSNPFQMDAPARCLAPVFWRKALALLCLSIAVIWGAFYGTPSYAQTQGCDPGCETGQRVGKDCSRCNKSQTTSEIAENLSEAMDTGGHAIIVIAGVFGAIVVAVSLYTMYRATKDDRAKPIGAVVGLFVGGLMLGIPILLWIMFNTILQ